MAEYVKREYAIDAVLDVYYDTPDIDLSGGKFEAAIRKIQAADVAPVRHGRWFPQVVLGQKAWDCSECKTLGSPHWKWCPVCGCKMDLED
jgi:hypothetical protein